MRNRRMIKTLGAIGVAAALLLLSGCDLVQGAVGYVRDFNPCGTILACDPAEYRFLTSGYEGPGADPDVDMTCTYPPYCGTQTIPAGAGARP